MGGGTAIVALTVNLAEPSNYQGFPDDLEMAVNQSLMARAGDR